MSEAYTGKKFFRIHRSDAGMEAYDDKYVSWLQGQIHEKDNRIADLEGQGEVRRIVDGYNSLVKSIEDDHRNGSVNGAEIVSRVSRWLDQTIKKVKGM